MKKKIENFKKKAAFIETDDVADVILLKLLFYFFNLTKNRLKKKWQMTRLPLLKRRLNQMRHR